MCGLFGTMASTIDKGDVNNTLAIGVTAALRGMHSTGVATAYRAKDGKRPVYGLLTDAVNASTLLTSKAYFDLVDEQGLQLILGHARHATLGAVNAENAHPFHVDPLIGCHNGTMNSFAPPHDLRDKETDSLRFYRTLAKAIEDGGSFQDVRDEHMRPSDAYALTWIDVPNNKLYITRNEARTLYMMKTEKSTQWTGTMHWASEPGFLRMMDSRSHTVFSSPVFFEPHKMYSFEIGNIESMEVTDIPVKNVVRQVLSHVSEHFRGSQRLITQDKQPPFVQEEKKEEKQEEKKKPQLIVKNGEVVSKDEEEILQTSSVPLVSSKNVRCHPASSLLPDISSHANFPRLVQRANAHYILKYRGWEGKLYAVGDIKNLLKEERSLVSNKRGSVRDNIIWLSEDIFVHNDEQSDMFVRNTFPKMFRGELVYVKKDEYEKSILN